MVYLIIFLIVLVIGGMFWYRYSNRVFDNKNLLESITDLDHDIFVPDAKLVIREEKTGFDVEIGPTGWPVGVSQKWEISLYEDNDFYYARLIYHEYMLWLSWDEPYLLCKIPKCNLTGDMKGDFKYRYQVLWDITYNTYRSYNYKPYMPDAKIEKINGHIVTLGDDVFDYYKYFVLCDPNHTW